MKPVNIPDFKCWDTKQLIFIDNFWIHENKIFRIWFTGIDPDKNSIAEMVEEKDCILVLE